MSYSSIEVSYKIIASINYNQGETISNLKLQKILYYMQGFFIAVFNEKLFNEPIEAWQYGPVVPQAYFYFNTFGSNAITTNGNEKIIELTNAEAELFNDVMEEYGQFSAVKLMSMTHEELPWKKTFHTNPKGEITFELMKEYFSTQIVA